MGAAPAGVRQPRLQVSAVVHQRVIPVAWVRAVERGSHEGLDLAVMDLFDPREELVKEYRAYVRFDEDDGSIEGEGQHRPRRVGAYARQGPKLFFAVGQAAPETGHDLVGRPLQGEGTPVVAKPRPQPEKRGDTPH